MAGSAEKVSSPDMKVTNAIQRYISDIYTYLILPICPFQVQARLFPGALRKQLEGGPMIFWLVPFLLAAAG